MAGRNSVAHRPVSSSLLAGDRSAAILGRPAPPPADPGGSARRRRRCRRPAAGRAVQSGMDLRHHERRRFCPRRCRLPLALHVEDAAMAGRLVLRDRRGGAVPGPLRTLSRRLSAESLTLLRPPTYWEAAHKYNRTGGRMPITRRKYLSSLARS